ncbi:hypothetical protein [Microbacterium sp. P5_E9]
MPANDDPKFRSLRGKDAALSRSRDPLDPEYVENRRELVAVSIAHDIQDRLAGAPPLTARQIDTLTSLLHSQGGVA